VAKLQRVGHMPVREGKMTCTSCHNPHGSTNTRMLRVGNYINETCTSCHAEKRGPFLWDHAPVRQGCNTCHDPHGSNNDRMLVAKLPMLCQRCHIGTKHPSTIYDANQLAKGSNRLIGRGCVQCHQQIHGSNSPAGNAFLR
jgi:DmsE family decaheme c-type cytochrome